MAEASSISGAEKAAILLMSLGEQDAAAVLKQLDARAVQKLGTAMATMKEVPRERVNEVMNTFFRTLETKGGATTPSTEFVRRVLTNSVGKQRADMLLDRILSGAATGGQGIEALRWMDPKGVAQLIAKEHPQVIAIVLAHLDGEQSGAVLELLPEEMRPDVLIRIATLGEVPQSALTELDQLVERQATSVATSPTRQVGGAKIVAEIMNSIDRGRSAELMDKIQQTDGDLHQRIKDLLFVFDDLLAVDDRGIQTLLREVQSDQLAIALRGAEPEVQDKVLRNMSKRAAEILKDDMEARGPVKVSEVEAAQKEIIAAALKLIEEGTIMIGGRGGGFV
ncbi:MAG TPA: flagellar motor switch protein FliG [Steroidobacteraceae bacterium]|nr:flagellar motor switch protein FliG [Steroidobacteraceae bacterium]